jgi:hypothetical protein
MLTSFRKVSMARTKRMRAAIVKLLEVEGKCNTRRIYDHINEFSKWGATMNQLTNVLSRDIRFAKTAEMDRVEAIQGGGYSVCVWELKDRRNDDNSQV